MEIGFSQKQLKERFGQMDKKIYSSTGNYEDK